MSAFTEKVRVARQWIEKAENDCRNARHTLEMGDDCPYDTVCFHAQQCVEKYFKALLAALSVDFGKTHDIGELVSLIPSKVNIPITIEEQEKLSDYAVAGRYPAADSEPFDRPEAQCALALAEKVRTAARSHLPKEAIQ